MAKIAEIVLMLINMQGKSDSPHLIDSRKRATENEIDAWQSANNLELPYEYQYFLNYIGECKLHCVNSKSFSMRILPLPEVRKLKELSGIDEIKDSWIAIADHHDGNFICLDLTSKSAQYGVVIDAFADTVPFESLKIAKTFTEFFGRAMADMDTSPGGGNKYGFWSRPKPKTLSFC